MTEQDFLKLSEDEQNTIVAPLFGSILTSPCPFADKCCTAKGCKGTWEHPKLGDLCEPPHYVDGGGNAFFEMFDSLPREDNGRWGFHEGPLGVTVESNLCGSPDGFAGTRNLAVALALLKAKGVITDE